MVYSDFMFDNAISSDFYFLECNPRFWYNMELTMFAGLNFVEAGVKVPKLAEQPLNVRFAGKISN